MTKEINMKITKKRQGSYLLLMMILILVLLAVLASFAVTLAKYIDPYIMINGVRTYVPEQFRGNGTLAYIFISAGIAVFLVAVEVVLAVLVFNTKAVEE
jgi:hypothetical protein